MNLLTSLRETLLQLRRSAATEPVEKRRIYRVRCSLPVVVVINEKEAVSGRVVNLSTTGMKVHLERRLKQGQIYRLFVRSRTNWSGSLSREAATEVSLRATAMWCKKATTTTVGYEVGFLFFSFSGMRTDDVIHFFREQLQVPVPTVSQKRRYARIRRRFQIQMTAPETETLTGSVRDLSLQGVQWIAERPFEEGSVVQLTISLDEDGPFETEARIMRCRSAPQGETGYEVGAKFTSLHARDHRKLALVVNRYLKEQWGAG